MFLSLCSEASTTIIIRRGVEDIRLEAKDSPSEDIPSRGQAQGQPFGGQTLSRPRTQAQVFSKKRKNSLQKKISRRYQKKGLQTNFSGELQKKVFKRFFQGIYKILTVQLIVLSSSRGKGNFWRLEASTSRPRTWPSRPRSRTSNYVIEGSTSDYNSSHRDTTGKFINQPSYKHFLELCRNGRWFTSLR